MILMVALIGWPFCTQRIDRKLYLDLAGSFEEQGCFYLLAILEDLGWLDKHQMRPTRCEFNCLARIYGKSHR